MESLNTNFQNIKKAIKYWESTKHERGFVTTVESIELKKVLQINLFERSEVGVIHLRNLRDFFVMYAGKTKSFKDMDYITGIDMISAITYIIDLAIVERGGTV